MNVFISCVKTKRDHQCRAEQLYISPLFINSLKYAKRLTTPDKIFILSAKYGVLRLNDIVSPYEQCLNNMSVLQRKKWAYNCYLQLQKYGANFSEETIFLCGVKYREFLIGKFPNHKIPLEKVSMGNQLKFYKGVFRNEKD